MIKEKLMDTYSYMNNKIVLSPSIGFPLETKQSLIKFRDSHTWSETCKEFPNINPETWRRWIHNRDIILFTTTELEASKRIMRSTQKRSEWKKNNPDKAIPSIMRKKHPFVVCCYHTNGNFKRRHKEFVKIIPRDLFKIAKKQKCKCAITGLKLTPETLSVDHIIPISKGGSHTVDNLRLVHKDINHMKNHYDDGYFLEMCKLVADNFTVI